MSAFRGSLFSSFKFAFQGLKVLWKHERNFRIHTLGGLVNVVLIFILDLSKTDSAFIFLACALVLVTEALNTALEKLCDRVEPRQDPAIGKIKDMAAAACFMAAFFALSIGLVIYLPYLWALL